MDMKNISNSIPQIVYEWSEEHADRNKSFVSVLMYLDGEIIERTFCTKRYKNDGIKITEVRRRSTNADYTIFKNLTYSMAGYNAVFEKKDIYSKSGWGYKVFDKEWFDRWDIATMPLNFDCRCLNKEILKTIDEFKYCGYSGGDVIEYLKQYRDNPLIEFFGKCGLPVSSSLISMASKDKHFRSFIGKNAADVRAYGAQATKYAYQHNMNIKDAAIKLNNRRLALKNIPNMRGTKLDYERIIDWCDAKKIDYSLYNDYIEAVIGLKLDLNDTKNIYPKKFKAMHDLRISEYESQKEKIDRIKRKKFYKAFSEAGERAMIYEYTNNNYSMISAKDISELVREGNTLNHCVAKMGYDKKMIDGEIVIMFLRNIDDVNKPFVTIEYSLKQNRLMQAYGKNNSKPSVETYQFINEWVEIVKKLRVKEGVTE